MSQETHEWLRENVLVGFTAKRGRAWWSRKVDENGGPANHWPEAIPLDVVTARIFDWEAGYQNVYVGADQATAKHQPSWQAIVNLKTGHVFDLPTDSYKIHDRKQWCLDTVSSVLDTSAGELQIAGAGQLKNGATSYVQFELPENVQAHGIEYRPFITASTSLDRSTSSQIVTGVTRVVCDNTLAVALGEKGHAFKVRHTAQSVVKLDAARDALGIVHTMADDFAKELDELLHTEVTAGQFDRIVKAMTDPKPRPDGKPVGVNAITMAANKAAKIRNLYTNDMRVAPWWGTAFGVEQAFNTYRQHEGIIRNALRPERNMLSVLDGSGAREDARVREAMALVLSKK